MYFKLSFTDTERKKRGESQLFQTFLLNMNMAFFLTIQYFGNILKGRYLEPSLPPSTGDVTEQEISKGEYKVFYPATSADYALPLYWRPERKAWPKISTRELLLKIQHEGSSVNSNPHRQRPMEQPSLEN